jgi:hypothetical protein
MRDPTYQLAIPYSRSQPWQSIIIIIQLSRGIHPESWSYPGRIQLMS